MQISIAGIAELRDLSEMVPVRRLIPLRSFLDLIFRTAFRLGHPFGACDGG
jgi:hypothetical protein